jgi:hypothetical protein
MRFNIGELEEKISKMLPDNVSRYAFHRAYQEAVHKGLDDTQASLEGWLMLEKLGYTFGEHIARFQKAGPGVYSSVKPNPHTADLLDEYIKSSGIPNPVPKDKLHSTIVYSRQGFAGYKPKTDMTIVQPNHKDEWGAEHTYGIQRLGENKEAIVLTYYCYELEEQFWQAARLGASWDHVGHVLHVTLSYDAPDFDITQLKLPEFDLVFEPEVVEAFEEDWADDLKKFEVIADISKMDTENKIVYGWANVIEKAGEIVKDLQGDMIDNEQELLDAAHDFMTNYREGHEMHEGVSKGEIVESIVFTKSLQKALGIDLGQVGWFIGYKVNDDTTWDKVKKGEYTAFSIGGTAIREPVA